jgi:hypothetical protein
LLDPSFTTPATRQAIHVMFERRKHGAARGSSTDVP